MTRHPSTYTWCLILLWCLTAGSSSWAQSTWTVTPSDFEFSMSMVVEVPDSDHEGDRLAAFVGNAVRGVAAPTTVGARHLYFLTVYANDAGESLSFRHADAISGDVTVLPAEEVFVANAVVGTVSAPRVMALSTDRPAPDAWLVNPAEYSMTMNVVARVRLPQGVAAAAGDRLAAFSGTSVRGVADAVDVGGEVRFFLTVHGSAAGTPLSYGFLDISTQTVHDLTETDTFEDNALLGSLAAPRVLSAGAGTGSDGGTGGEGAPDWSVNPADFQYGMNIVARPSGETGPDDLLAVFSSGELRGVVGPTSVGDAHLFFLTAYSNAASGSLTARLYRASTGAIETLSPSLDFAADGVLGTVASPVALTGNGAPADDIRDNVDAWTVDVASYERTMSVVAAFRVDGEPVDGDADRMAAFVGDEIRGATDGTRVGDRVLFFLTLYANGEEDTFDFRGYDSAAGELRLLDGTLTFISNAVEGTVAAPLTFDARWPDACAPTVSVAGVSDRTLPAGQALVLESAASLPSCAPSSPALSLQWQQVAGPVVALEGADRALLQVPADALQPGSTYIFEQTATTESEPIRSGSATVSVTVLRSALEVTISGGDRTIGTGTAFTLDAGASQDPDDGSALDTFSWSCAAVSSGETCLDGALAATPSITIAAGALSPGAYRFRATGTKDTRSGWAEVVVTILEGSVPVVDIAAQPAAMPVDPAERLTLRGSATSDVSGELTWAWSIPGLDLEDTAVSSTGPSGEDLELEPGALEEGTTYTATLAVTDSQGGEGTASFPFTTRSSPSGGALAVSPVEGNAFTTVFDMDAAGWGDGGAGLLYQFLVRRTGGALIPLTDLVARSSSRLVLPPGNPADNDRLVVVVRVMNAQGGVTEAEVPVTVRPAVSVQDATLSTDAPSGQSSDEGPPRIVLDGDFSVTGTLNVLDLDLDLNGNTLELGPNGTLNETGGQVTGDGGVRTTRTLNGPSEQNIGGIGLGLATSSNMGATVIERRHASVTLPDGSSSIRRRFSIEPTTQPENGITITIRFSSQDLAGNDASTLTCYVFDESEGVWTTEGVTVVARTNTSVTCQAPHLSEWTLGPEGADVPMTLNAQVFLEGPQAAGGGNGSMTSGLGGSIPLSQPYSNPHFTTTPMAYTGAESVAAVPADVVDWILVELRSANSLIARQAAFVLTDGRIVRMDGTGRLRFPGTPTGDYFVVVRHRNHLPVISPTAVSLSDTQGAAGAPFDISFEEPLLAADADGDGEVQNDDKNAWWFTALGQSGYLPGDFNLDGTVTTADRDVLWRRNVGRGALTELK